MALFHRKALPVRGVSENDVLREWEAFVAKSELINRLPLPYEEDRTTAYMKAYTKFLETLFKHLDQ